MARARFTATAEKQIESQMMYLAERAGPQYATEFLSSASRMATEIGEAPAMGSPRPEFGRGGHSARSRIMGNHVLVYFDDMVPPIVVAVLHVRQDIEGYFDNYDPLDEI